MTTKAEIPTYTTQDDLRDLFDLPVNQYGLGIPKHLWVTVNDVELPVDFASYLTEKMIEKSVEYRQLGINTYSTKGFELRGAVEVSHGVFFAWQAVVVHASMNRAHHLYMRSASPDNMLRLKVEGRFVSLVSDDKHPDVSIDCGVVLFHGNKERYGVGASEWKRSYVKGEQTWVKTMEKITNRPYGAALPHVVPDDISRVVLWLGTALHGKVAELIDRKTAQLVVCNGGAQVSVPTGALTRNVAMVTSDYAETYIDLFSNAEYLANLYAQVRSDRYAADLSVSRFCGLGRELMEAIEADYPYLKIEVPSGIDFSHYHNALARQTIQQGQATLQALAKLLVTGNPVDVPTDLEVRSTVMTVAILMASVVNDSRSSLYIANAVKYFENALETLKAAK